MIFGRKKPTPASDATPDAHFPFASRALANNVRQSALSYLTERGHRPIDEGASIRLEDGQVLGLHNLVATANSSDVDIDAFVRERLGNQLAAQSAPSEGPADPRSIFVRLHDVSRLPARPEYEPIEIFPGIVAILAVDRPEAVEQVFTGLEIIGNDVARAYDDAVGNILDLPVPEHAQVQIVENNPNSVVHIFQTDDYFGASRVLIMPRLLEAMVGESIPPDGVLVVIPNRDTLVVHLMKDASVQDVIPRLLLLGHDQCESMPGPISPLVYHMNQGMDGSVFARLGPEGKVKVEAEPHVAESLRRFGLM